MLDHAAESARFDPDGHYVRRWLPVLARLPAKWIHRCATRPPASQYRRDRVEEVCCVKHRANTDVPLEMTSAFG